MKNWIACAVLCAVAACGKSDKGPDVTKMKPEEACKVIAKRAWECKDTITDALKTMAKAHGASETEMNGIANAFGTPMKCEGRELEGMDQLQICYDHDCKKLAACFGSMLMAGMEGGGDSPRVPPEATGTQSVEPAQPAPSPSGSGSGSASSI
jgi:hypothetical protein